MTEVATEILLSYGLPLFGGMAFVAFLWTVTFYRNRIASVGRAIRCQTAKAVNPEMQSQIKGVSIVVVAGDDAEALEHILNKIFEQEFGAPMEVIVVNDGKNEDVKDVVTRMKHLAHRPNLYVTFTPPGLRNVSHRKLALTLGIKAANFPIILAVTEQSRIYSTQWLARMAEPFARPEIEVVIGSALPSAKLDKSHGRRYRSFINGADAAEWLSAALRGKPYRAHRANMAFTRNAFFKAGGFNNALNLLDGDDDLFIAKIANKNNTAVVCAAQAAVRYTHPDPARLMRDERTSRFYTCKHLGKGTARFMSFSYQMLWALVIASSLGITCSALLRQWLFLGGFVGALLLSWVLLAVTWRKTLKALRCLPISVMILPRLLRRPFTNMRHRAYTRRHRREYHTWTSMK